MGKEVKTNAVRILERNKVPYELLTYECDEFIDGIHSAEATGTPVAQTYKPNLPLNLPIRRFRSGTVMKNPIGSSLK